MTQAKPTKRERTRHKLIEAGLAVVAERGEALTASDVVAVAEVSNGTFYNHFVDRDDFIQALARESLAAITEASADDTKGADPAWRFAVASVRVLQAAQHQPLWGRAILRLADCPTPLHAGIQQHLRADLAEGHESGRFVYGDDPITIDLVSGALMATIRRVVAADRPTQQTNTGIAAVVARLLEAIGVPSSEATSLAELAMDSQTQAPAALDTRAQKAAE